MESDASSEGLREAFEGAKGGGAAEEEGGRGEVVQVLTFSLADEWHGFRLADLVEIIGGADLTPIPFTPPFVLGVLNHRGTVVPVVDLKRVFDLQARYRRGEARIVLVSSEGSVVGFLADAISDVVEVPESHIEPPLSTIEKVKAEFMEGCVRREQGLLVLLSAEALIHHLRARPEE